MGYSVKWVVDNLGITRNALRYYEKENLLSIKGSRNSSNNYRDYTEKDVQTIWGIKLLIRIGFTAKEVYKIMNDPKYNFDEKLSEKVIELEGKYNDALINMQFAKSIKTLGCIPTVSKVGSVKFEGFMKYVLEHWNYYDDPETTSFMQMVDLIYDNKSNKLSYDNVEKVIELFEENSDIAVKLTKFGSYFQVISDMKTLDYKSDAVQKVVDTFIKRVIVDWALDEKQEINPKTIAKNIAILFVCGDVSKLNVCIYSEEGCKFISKALKYYAGLDVENI